MIHSVVFKKQLTGTGHMRHTFCILSATTKDRGARASPAAVAGRTGGTKLFGVGGVERCGFGNLNVDHRWIVENSQVLYDLFRIIESQLVFEVSVLLNIIIEHHH